MSNLHNRGIPASKEDEMALLAQVRRLDQQALERVHDAYYPALFRYIAYKVGDRETAEDLTSETFLRAIIAIDGFRGDASIKTWLLRIARNLYLRYRDREKRSISLEHLQANGWEFSEHPQFEPENQMSQLHMG